MSINKFFKPKLQRKLESYKKYSSDKRKAKFYDFSFKKAIIVYLIFTVVAVMIDLKYRYVFWFSSTYILLFMSIFSLIPVLIILSIELLKTNRINVSKFSVMIPLICISGFLGGRYVSEFQAELSKESAKPIISALEKCRLAHNIYPSNLNELVPEYLERIPDSEMGWFDIPYSYKLSAPLNYEIKFPSFSEEAWVYYGNSSNSNNWRNVPD